MATAKMHFQPSRRRRDAAQSRAAALRLLQVTRAADLLPVLLQEVVALGYPRAMVLERNAGSGEMSPIAALNWPVPAKLSNELAGREGAAASVLASNRSAVRQPGVHASDPPLSLHPMLYSRASPCWEARANAENCMAAQNARPGKAGAWKQPCSVCAMAGYAAVVVVELRGRSSETELAALQDLISLANAHLSHLVKIEHYCHRVRVLETALAGRNAGIPVLEEGEQPVHQLPFAPGDVQAERRMLEIEKFASAGRLAATIAHEVNNPMEAIKNAVYLLAGSVPESALPVYSILKSETERVARVVRQMLGLYRDAEPAKAVNVNTLIEDTLLLLNRQMQRANVQVEVELGVLPDAVIAADQIRQVLSNLVINARDAMPDGGRLRIRSRHRICPLQTSSWIRILIADSGAGIPREIIGDIFQPFVSTKGEKGTGLGLWIVKGIIQNHAGKIGVRSRVGQGTVFVIDLPVAKP